MLCPTCNKHSLFRIGEDTCGDIAWCCECGSIQYEDCTDDKQLISIPMLTTETLKGK